jgi:hypothetical protein
MEPEFNIRMSASRTAKNFRVRVSIFSRDDELLATDEGNLVSLTAQNKMIKRLVEHLGLAPPPPPPREGTEAEPGAAPASGEAAPDRAQAFAGDFKNCWLEFYQAYQQGTPDTPAKTARDLLMEMPEETRLAAEALAEDAELVDPIGEDLATSGIAGEVDLALSIYLQGTSRQLDEPLSIRVHGPSASGKNYIIDRVVSLYPPEAVLCATQMTPQALFYMPPGSLVHRWIVAGERSRKEDDEAAEATRALREMISSGRLSKAIPIKNEHGILETQLIEQEGPIAFIESTSLAKVFAEDANRCLTVHTDERKEQTERIVTTLANKYTGDTVPTDIDRIVQKHWAFQRLLQPHAVVVPYAARLGELLKCDRVEMRRGFPQIVAMIKAIALLHQFQRQRDDQGRLLATPQDYAIARRLLLKPMRRLLGVGLSDSAQRFHERLQSWFAHRSFTTTEAMKEEPHSRQAVRGWLIELQDAGYVVIITEGRGRTPTTWKLEANPPEEKVAVLPKLASVCV